MYTYFSFVNDTITYFPNKPIEIIDELDDSSIYYELKYDEIQDCYYSMNKNGLYKYKNRDKKYEYVFVCKSRGNMYLFADYQKYSLLDFVVGSTTKIKIQFNDNSVDYSDVNIFMNIRRQLKKIVIFYINIDDFYTISVKNPTFCTINNNEIIGNSYVIYNLEIIIIEKHNFGIVRDLSHNTKVQFIKDIYNDNLTYLFKYEESMIKIASRDD